MRARLKSLSQQVILITGASSGIGRQTAVRAAAAGARVILVARNESALRDVVREIESSGGEAIFSVADVADAEAFRRAADLGIQRFGRIDTWVNNAGVGMFTRILQTDIDDDRRLFETNFWGLVIGSRLAVTYLLQTGGGALINLGSEVSDVAVPVQGMYSTSKHAVKGFTDALREEILHEKLPISVTLIKPAAIDTPFPRHAKNYFDRQSTLPAPVYAVDLVADQILHAAQHGGRDLYVGGGGRLMAMLGQHFPSLMDRFMAKFMVGQQLTDRPADHSNEALHQSRGFHSAEGDAARDHHIQQVSCYNLMRRNPMKTTLLALGLVAAGIAVATKAETQPPMLSGRGVKKLAGRIFH